MLNFYVIIYQYMSHISLIKYAGIMSHPSTKTGLSGNLAPSINSFFLPNIRCNPRKSLVMTGLVHNGNNVPKHKLNSLEKEKSRNPDEKSPDNVPDDLLERQEKLEEKIHQISEIKSCNNQIPSGDLISEITDLYHDAVELKNESRELIDNFKSGEIDSAVENLSEIISDSKEVVSESKQIIKDFKDLYHLIALLSPIMLWGITVLITKKPPK